MANEKSPGLSIRAIIFDFGGVLIRMVDDRPRLELAGQLNVPLTRIDDLVFFSDTARKASKGEITVSKHWEAVRQALGIAPDAMPSFLDKYWSADDINWKLLEYIRGLRPRYKVVLLSNAWDDLRQTMHQRWNIDGLFDELIISAEVKLVKPDPRIFQLTLDRIHVQPNEAVFIDDMAENVEAARKEGIIAIQYQEAQPTIDELNRILSTG